MSEPQAQQQWGSAAEFIITSLGFAVGLGNIWRFPNMVYANGGGAFLIPYVICLIFIAVPLLLVEAAVGQYSSRGPVGVWDMVPLFRGCGAAVIFLSFVSTVYYNIPIAWASLYLVNSMQSKLPWTYCGPWATANCSAGAESSSPKSQYGDEDDLIVLGGTVDLDSITLDHYANQSYVDNSTLQSVSYRTSPAEEFFYQRTLGITGGLHDWGTLSWELLVANFVVWCVIFAVVCKGAASLGKVAYFTTLFPYVMLTALLVFTSMLPGAGLGVKYYLQAEVSKLAEVKVWRAAISQVFFSTGCASGGVIQMASYNRFSHDIVRDTLLVPLLDGLTSLFAGFGVFTVLGYMAQLRNVPVDKVVEGGPGLIFITYPEALAQMPGGYVWSSLFFFMVCILGLSSQFPAIETICGTLSAVMPWSQRTWWTKILFRFAICMMAFFLGIFFYFGSGYFAYFLVDERIIGYPMILIGFVESVGITWFYGADRLMANIEEMTGPWRFPWAKKLWIVCWKYIAPGALLLIFVLDVANMGPLEVLGYVYPSSATSAAFLIMITPLAIIVGYAMHMYCTECQGYKFLRKTTAPLQSWGPSSASLNELAKRYAERADKVATSTDFSNGIHPTETSYVNKAMDYVEHDQTISFAMSRTDSGPIMMNHIGGNDLSNFIQKRPFKQGTPSLQSIEENLEENNSSYFCC